MKLSRLALTTVILALLSLVAACAPQPSAPGTPIATRPGSAGSGRPHNDADTMFAQMMVVHHEGAIEMAALAEEAARSTQVRDLAARIKRAQGPEIDQMRGWLQSWGEPGPEDSQVPGMGHGGMDMGGLSQQQAMEELKRRSGSEFDHRFLTLMIEHHKGAITMAEEELQQGSNEAAMSLARSIVTAQQTEIQEMQALIETLR